MKVRYNSIDGRFSVDLEGDQTQIFAQVAAFQEIFENTKCGKCGNEDVRFVIRTNDDVDYPELHCQNTKCGAKLTFGKRKVGGALFPHRKNSEGEFISGNGWGKFNKQTGKIE